MIRNVVLAAFGMCAIFALTLPAYSQTTVIIHMKDLRFSPDHQSVNAGDTVTFVNDDDYAHTVTAVDKSFDSGNIAARASWTHSFTTPGTYGYFCVYHLPNMKGELVVLPPATIERVPSALPTQTATRSPTHLRSHSAVHSAVVQIKPPYFSPQMLKLHTGDSVTFVNGDSHPHTVTAMNKSFNSGKILARGVWTHRFLKAGTYRYICLYRRGVMKGDIVVVGRK